MKNDLFQTNPDADEYQEHIQISPQIPTMSKKQSNGDS